MLDRCRQLVSDLQLAPHPEGGYFREIHRASLPVQPSDGRSTRSALTVIYFVLTASDVSRWHRVASDEAWHFHEGDGLELFVCDPDFSIVATNRLGPFGAGAEPVRVVPAGHWQAARCTGEYALVSCAVGPGFEFTDFEMLRDVPLQTARLQQAQPAFASLI